MTPVVVCPNCSVAFHVEVRPPAWERAAAMRSALIRLRDAVWDEVQPTEGDYLHTLVLETDAALQGTLADGDLAPTDLTDGEPS